jgi:hypothetical protein
MHHGGKRVAPVRLKNLRRRQVNNCVHDNGRYTVVVVRVHAFMRSHHTTCYLSRTEKEGSKGEDGTERTVSDHRSSPIHAWESIKDNDVLRHVDGAGEVEIVRCDKNTKALGPNGRAAPLGPIISETIIAQKPRDHATNCDYVDVVCTWDHCGNFALPSCPFLTSKGRQKVGWRIRPTSQGKTTPAAHKT